MLLMPAPLLEAEERGPRQRLPVMTRAAPGFLHRSIRGGQPVLSMPLLFQTITLIKAPSCVGRP